MRMVFLRWFVLLSLLSAPLSAVGVAADEKNWVLRPVGPLYLEGPDSWSPFSEKDASGLYFGKPPGKGGTSGSLFLLVGREKAKGYEDVLASLKKSPGDAFAVDFQQEEMPVGGRDAVVFTNRVTRKETGALFSAMKGVLWKEPSKEGILMAAAGGDGALFEVHEHDLDRMVRSARFDKPVPTPPEEVDVPDLPDLILPPLDDEDHRSDPLQPEDEGTPRERPTFASDGLLEEEIRRAKSALALRDEGALLLARGDREGAMERFRRSLADFPDDELAAFVESAGRRRSAEDREKLDRASALRREAVELQSKDLLKDALRKYRESLALNDDEELRGVISVLEKHMAERAKALISQGEAFEKADRLEEALAAYNESLTWAEDEAVKLKVSAVGKEIQKQREEASPERVLAAALWREGEALEAQGKGFDALEKYRESLKIHDGEERRRQAESLEETLKDHARILIRDGVARQRDGDFKGALEKFRESQGYYPLREVEAHIEKLREFLNK